MIYCFFLQFELLSLYKFFVGVESRVSFLILVTPSNLQFLSCLTRGRSWPDVLGFPKFASNILMFKVFPIFLMLKVLQTSYLLHLVKNVCALQLLFAVLNGCGKRPIAVWIMEVFISAQFPSIVRWQNIVFMFFKKYWWWLKEGI